MLDAACGMGKYWPLILGSGRTVFGIDQSQGVLDQAKEKFPQVSSRKLGLQELDASESFAGAVCMDALELVPPEDWPVILRNLQSAIQPSGYLYFTVEITEERNLEQAFAEGQELGLPVVYGEANWVPDDGYHHFLGQKGKARQELRPVAASRDPHRAHKPNTRRTAGVSLLRLDVAGFICCFFFVSLILANALTKSANTSPQFSCDPSNAPRPKEQDDDDQDNNPFTAVW